MVPCEGVGEEKELRRVGGGLSGGGGHQFHGPPLLKRDGDILRGIASLLDRIQRKLPHILWRG